MGNSIFDKYIPTDESGICNTFTLGLNESASNLPLSQCVLSYTFFYLFFTIRKYNYYYQNIPTLVFVPLLILSDSIWNVMNQCNLPKLLFCSFVMGAIGGTAWAKIVDSTNDSKLQIIPGSPASEVCDRPAKNTFRCNVYKDGVLQNAIPVK